MIKSISDRPTLMTDIVLKLMIPIVVIESDRVIDLMVVELVMIRDIDV